MGGGGLGREERSTEAATPEATAPFSRLAFPAVRMRDREADRRLTAVVEAATAPADRLLPDDALEVLGRLLGYTEVDFAESSGGLPESPPLVLLSLGVCTGKPELSDYAKNDTEIQMPNRFGLKPGKDIPF